ncbi:NAD(P)-dependent oxidoreductase [Rhodococcus gannanensis]|uniref:NAD(P)-dependent oxidoreductase n=1 Tax=Rhodococcus gannanensis TaxID=1960308 RepID=A0ABW4P7R4_9NOCA
MTRIGFVGAGRMGGPMIRRLAAAGHEVRARAGTADKERVVTELGAVPVADAAAAADGADIVVVCVFDDDQVRQVCLDGPLLTAMSAGSTLVVHTTGSPDTVRSIAEAARGVGVTVVDAPVSGGPHDIAAGTLTVFAGGDAAAVDVARAALAAYADPVVHVGGTGSGQCVKLVNNALFAANIALLGDAVRLAGQLGVDEGALLGALLHGSGASRALDGVARRGSVASFTASVGEFLRKDVSAVRHAVADLGGSLGLLDEVVGTQWPRTDTAATSDRNRPDDDHIAAGVPDVRSVR